MRVILLGFFAISCLYGQTSINHKFTELGILSYPTTKMKPLQVVKNVPRMDNVKVNASVSLFKAGSASFIIKPERPHTLTAKSGLQIRISPKSFFHKDGKQAKGEVKLELTFLRDKLQFVSSGLGLKYYDSIGQGSYMEPKSIFRIRAFQGSEELLLGKGKVIRVNVPARFANTRNFYHMDLQDGRWKYYIQPSFSGKKEEGEGKQVRIGKLGHFMYGEVMGQDTACVKGKIIDPQNLLGKEVQVISLGLRYNTYYSKWTKNDTFHVNVNKNSRARVLVIDKQGYYGISPVIDTPSKSGSTAKKEGPGNYKKDIGTIKILSKPITAKDKKKLLQKFMPTK
ncbi:MAG: hypothetical protein AAF518_08555 [Spirochaetota bacterium]